MSGNANAADLTVFIGSTGSGKTLLTKQGLAARRDRPMLIWSWKERVDRYAPMFGRLVEGKRREMAARALAGEHVVYVPDRSSDDLVASQFDYFCEVALELGRRIVLVEEMSVVASSRSSPARWRQIVTEGRGLGLVPIVTTQRPQLCDATILDAATVIYCGRLNSGRSQKTMADAMGGLELDRVRRLKPLEFLLWRTGVDGAELVRVKPPRKKS